MKESLTIYVWTINSPSNLATCTLGVPGLLKSSLNVMNPAPMRYLVMSSLKA